MSEPEEAAFAIVERREDQVVIDVETPRQKKRVTIDYDPDTDSYSTTLLPYARYRSLEEIAFLLRRSHPDFGGTQ